MCSVRTLISMKESVHAATACQTSKYLSTSPPAQIGDAYLCSIQRTGNAARTVPSNRLGRCGWCSEVERSVQSCHLRMADTKMGDEQKRSAVVALTRAALRLPVGLAEAVGKVHAPSTSTLGDKAGPGLLAAPPPPPLSKPGRRDAIPNARHAGSQLDAEDDKPGGVDARRCACRKIEPMK